MTHTNSSQNQTPSSSSLTAPRLPRGLARPGWARALRLGLLGSVLAPLTLQAEPASPGPVKAPAPAVSRSERARDGRPTRELEERQLWDAERTWVRALETGDAGLLERLVDADLFSFIGPDGEYEDRETYLAGYRALPAQGIKVQKVDLFDVKPRILGETAVVTGRAVAKVQMKDQTFVENVRFTRVYQRRGQAWRMVAGQGTRLPAQAPR